jgi:hypothetical protein
MDISCECGKFQARLKAFPKDTPGRLVCYCDDCQAYMRHLKREDLLDANGGTEVVPVYPADIQIIQGAECLTCTQLAPGGTLRFSTTCCNTPIGNTRAGTPWAGLMRRVYTVKDAGALDRALGPVRSRIMGKFAKGTPPAGTPAKFNLKALMTVMPFMLKGKLLGKARPSPFFAPGSVTLVAPPRVLTPAEREALRPGAAG